MAIFFFFFFLLFGFAKSRPSILSRGVLVEDEGDEVCIGGQKDATEGKLPILSDANKTTAETIMVSSDGNFTIDCIIIVK